jgi:uncharacterized protein DUF3489
MIRLALNQQQDYPEKTGFPAPAERYCVQFRAFDVLRDPAPPALRPRWGFGGDGKECRKPKEISMSTPVTKRRTTAFPKDKKKAHRKGVAQAPAIKPGKRKREKGAPVRQVRASVGRTSRSESKQAQIIAMLRAPGGATIEALMRATGWQSHSVRGFLAGVIRKKLGLNLVSAAADSGRVYRIADRTTARTESAA